MDTKQLEGMWATRPVRPISGRTIAGVCAGVGARYRVDPTLVKVAFVVAALFGGSGLILYLAAWVALPSADRTRDHLGSIADGRAEWRRRRHLHGLSNGRMILLAVLVIVLATSFGPNRTWGSGGLVGLALMLLGWWLLYQRTPTPPAGTSVDTLPEQPDGSPTEQFQRWTPRGMTMPPSGFPTAPMTPTPATPASPAATTVPTTTDPADDAETGHTETTVRTSATTPQSASAPTAPAYTATTNPTTPVATPFAPTDPPVPPAWDPLGAAQFAWDLPEPATPSNPPTRPRSPLTLIVVGLAILTGAIGAALHQAGVDWFTPGRIVAMTLAVVAAGLVFAGLRRTPRKGGAGLVPIGVALAVATVIVTTAGSFDGLRNAEIGDRDWKPHSENEIAPSYQIALGSLNLDLRAVELTADRTVTLHAGVGEIKVHVPPNMNVRATCDVRVGDSKCPTGLDGGRDGTEGPVLTIDASARMGDVEIIR